MLFKPLLTLILICIVAWQTVAQTSTAGNVILKGVVLDKEINRPIAYVSVGILNKPIGTVTDTTGHFESSP